jgi:hypothetical protein
MSLLSRLIVGMARVGMLLKDIPFTP